MEEKIITTKADLQGIFSEQLNTVENQFAGKLDDMSVEIKNLKQENFDLQQKISKPIGITIKEQPIKYGRILHALAFKSLNRLTNEQTVERFGSDVEFALKAMNSNTLAAGGALIQQSYATDITPQLQAGSTVRRAGAIIMPMPNGNMLIPKSNGITAMQWVGEAQQSTAGSVSMETINLTRKIGVCPLAVSNDMLKFSNYNTANFIQTELIKNITAGEDYAFIQGLGTAYTPKGLIYQVNSANTFTMTGSISAITRLADLTKCVTLILQANALQPTSKLVWIGNPQTIQNLRIQTDANSNKMDYAKELREFNTIEGFPVYTTTNCPSTHLILVDINECVIGEGEAPAVNFFENGTWYDGTNTISGASSRCSFFQAEIQTDFAIRQDKAISVINGLTWGA